MRQSFSSASAAFGDALWPAVKTTLQCVAVKFCAHSPRAFSFWSADNISCAKSLGGGKTDNQILMRFNGRQPQLSTHLESLRAVKFLEMDETDETDFRIARKGRRAQIARHES